jgi:flagellar protein FlaF
VGVKAGGSGRELEAAALFKAARLLEGARQDWESPDRARRLSDALRYNQRLWTIFQTDLARPDHELPVDLRVAVLRLSAFVDRRTFELIADPRPARLDSLIEINRQLALGLSAQA